MRNVSTAILVGILILLSGCGHEPVVTQPMAPIVVKEALIPIAACPKQVNAIVYPIKPHLAIDDLTPADKNNYKKVGTAYMQSINELVKYSTDLENIAYGIKDMCHSVNTPSSGTQQ